jgi:hypothetical protein
VGELVVLVIVPAVLAAVMLVVAAATTRYVRAASAALRAAAPVARATGPVTVGLVGERDWDRYGRVSQDGLDFHVSEPVARAFFTPGSYTLYHLPRLKRLLAAEPAWPAVVSPA